MKKLKVAIIKDKAGLDAELDDLFPSEMMGQALDKITDVIQELELSPAQCILVLSSLLSTVAVQLRRFETGLLEPDEEEEYS